MKNFFTSMLGALVALIIFAGGAVLLFIGILGAIVAMSGEKKAPTFESGSYVVFDLSANITDAPPTIDFSQFTGDHNTTLQLRAVTRALRAAKNDDRVAGVMLKGALTPMGYGSGFAVLKEVRAALLDFKASGKPVKAYLEAVTTKDYYLASAASDIALDPYGMILMPGLASEPMFYTGAFEKYGIGVQVTRVGKYKAYVEPYTRKDMSPENREQTQKLLNDLWSSMLADIAQTRSLTPEKIQAVVDAEGIIRPEPAKKGKLVDRIAYRDEIIDELRAKTGPSSHDKITFKQIELSAYVKLSKDVVDVTKKSTDETKPAPGGRGRVAIIYAEGAIVDGEGERGEIGGVKFARELRRLRQDDSVKAIVLRVNSPGGSASASENIGREVRLTRKVKPVVVSMGTYAASGGYWIAAYGDRIFAEPTTITGSIGVFAIIPTAEKIGEKLGIHTAGVTTTWLADAYNPLRPLDPRFTQLVQNGVNHIYSEFTTKVAQARKSTPQKIDEVGQGRVWTGQQAQERGLVDTLGSYRDALNSAAKRASLKADYRVAYIEHDTTRLERFFELLGVSAAQAIHFEVKLGLLPSVLPAGAVADVSRDLAWLTDLAAARKPFAAVTHCMCGSP